jgi:hypothetical protein
MNSNSREEQISEFVNNVVEWAHSFSRDQLYGHPYAWPELSDDISHCFDVESKVTASRPGEFIFWDFPVNRFLHEVVGEPTEERLSNVESRRIAGLIALGSSLYEGDSYSSFNPNYIDFDSLSDMQGVSEFEALNVKLLYDLIVCVKRDLKSFLPVARIVLASFSQIQDSLVLVDSKDRDIEWIEAWNLLSFTVEMIVNAINIESQLEVFSYKHFPLPLD